MDIPDRRKNARATSKFTGITVALWALALSLAIHSLAGFYYALVPMEHWVVYKKAEPVKDKFKIGEEIHFISDFDVFRNSSVTFYDTMMCDTIDDDFGFHQYGAILSKNYQLRRQTIKDSIFPMPGVDVAGKCYLRTSLVLHLPFGIDRFKKVKSNFFYIEGEN